MEKAYDNLDLDYQLDIIKQLLKFRKHSKNNLSNGIGFIEKKLKEADFLHGCLIDYLSRLGQDGVTDFNRLTEAEKEVWIKKVFEALPEEWTFNLPEVPIFKYNLKKDFFVLEILTKLMLTASSKLDNTKKDITKEIKLINNLIGQKVTCQHPLFIDLYNDDLFIQKRLDTYGLIFPKYKQRACAHCKEIIYKNDESEYNYRYQGPHALMNAHGEYNPITLSIDLDNHDYIGGPTIKVPNSYLSEYGIPNYDCINSIHQDFILYLYDQRTTKLDIQTLAGHFQKEANKIMRRRLAKIKKEYQLQKVKR